MGLTKQYHDDKYTNFEQVMRKSGDWNTAEQLNIQIIEMRKRVLGADHLDTILSMANLGTTYWNQERLKEAKQLDVQVMNMRKRLIGKKYPDTLSSMVLQFSHPYSSFLAPLLLFSCALLLMTHILTCDFSYDSFLYFDSCIYLLNFGICCAFTGI